MQTTYIRKEKKKVETYIRKKRRLQLIDRNVVMLLNNLDSVSDDFLVLNVFNVSSIHIYIQNCNLALSSCLTDQ